jgi:hypothetical protein
MLRIYEGKIQYHRNGVGGEPFYVVKFYDDEAFRDLIAVIPSSMREDDSDYECYVIDPSDPFNSKWRGDVLYYGLVEAGLWDMVKAADEGYIAELKQRLTEPVVAAS